MIPGQAGFIGTTLCVILIYMSLSNLEDMQLSLLEAMSYGNFCLVSDIPEYEEVVADKDMVVFEG